MYLSKKKVEETEIISALKMSVVVIQISLIKFKSPLVRTGPFYSGGGRN